MAEIRAILFDFGGTLYDYGSLAPGESEALLALAGEAGIEAPPDVLHRARRHGLRQVFRDYLGRPYFLHRDFFRDAIRHAMRRFDVELGDEDLDRHFRRQWELHARDFALRPGVPETLGELRRRGLHLGIVSNIDEDQLEHLGRLARLEEHFDSILSSEAAGSCKPDHAIFDEALRRAGCAPAEALFVGDSIDADVAGANAVGCRSVLLWHRDDRSLPDRGPRPHHVIRRIPDVLSLLDGSDS